MFFVLLMSVLVIALVVVAAIGSGASGHAGRAGDARPARAAARRTRRAPAPRRPAADKKHAMSSRHGDNLSTEAARERRHELDARKTIHAFDFILKSYGQTAPWSTATERDDYTHDLAVMLRHGDLKHASLELLGADERVIYRHRIEFGTGGGPAAVDAARGIELPLLAAGQVARQRLLVAPVARKETYRSHLRMNWTRAQQLGERTGSRFDSEHTRCVNARRMTGEVFVTDEARYTVTVFNVAAGSQYAFGRAPGLAADVFLHRAQCEQPTAFHGGQRLDCLVIQTPRGLQGRSIRAA